MRQLIEDQPINFSDLIPKSNPAMDALVARLEHNAILLAVDTKKAKAWQYSLMPEYLGALCRDLPGYAPERMIRCLDALLQYHRSRPVKVLIGGDEVLANICGARLYARYLRFIQHSMRKKRGRHE